MIALITYGVSEPEFDKYCEITFGPASASVIPSKSSFGVINVYLNSPMAREFSETAITKECQIKKWEMGLGGVFVKKVLKNNFTDSEFCDFRTIYKRSDVS